MDYENGDRATSNAQTCISHYRAIYILNRDCNTAFGMMFIPFMKIIFIAAFIFGFVAYVRYFDELDPFSIALLGFSQGLTLLMVILMSILMSSFYELSAKFPGNIRRSGLHKESKTIFERELRSCPKIRCQVGGMYSMERQAKLTLLGEVINALVFVLL